MWERLRLTCRTARHRQTQARQESQGAAKEVVVMVTVTAVLFNGHRIGAAVQSGRSVWKARRGLHPQSPCWPSSHDTVGWSWTRWPLLLRLLRNNAARQCSHLTSVTIRCTTSTSGNKDAFEDSVDITMRVGCICGYLNLRWGHLVLFEKVTFNWSEKVTRLLFPKRTDTELSNVHLRQT